MVIRSSSYFNIDKIVEWLLDLPPEKQHRLYHGSCVMLSKFQRNNLKPLYVPYYLSHYDLIWPYCVGVGYVISSDLLAPLVLASRHYPYMLQSEDLNVGLANLMLNITPYRYHDYYWFFLGKKVYPERPVCQWRKHFGLQHIPLSDVKNVSSLFEDPTISC